MKICKDDHPVQQSLRKIEDLLRDLNISIRGQYGANLILRDREGNEYMLRNTDFDKNENRIPSGANLALIE